jgi:hypothetical protein
VCVVPCWSQATIGLVLDWLEWRRAMTSLGVEAISSPVEAEREVGCEVYNLAVFSSPTRYIVVAVATISEMMNCVLEWTFSIDNNDDDNEPLIFRYPTPSNLPPI